MKSSRVEIDSDMRTGESLGALLKDCGEVNGYHDALDLARIEAKGFLWPIAHDELLLFLESGMFGG